MASISIPGNRPVKWWHRWEAMTWISFLGVAVALFLGIVSLRETSKGLRQNNLAMIYTLGFDITKFQQEKPKLSKFLDKQLRQPWITEKEYLAEVEVEVTKLLKEQQAAARDEYKKLWEKYCKLDDDEQTLLYLGCERIADFSQIAYMQQEVLPDVDWNTWWSYITDQYDESPFYRVFLAKRPTWYAFLEDIKPGKREKIFRR